MASVAAASDAWRRDAADRDVRPRRRRLLDGGVVVIDGVLVDVEQARREALDEGLVSTSPLDGASTYDSTSASNAPDLNDVAKGERGGALDGALDDVALEGAPRRGSAAAPSDGSKPNASTGECAPREGAAAESCSAPARGVRAFAGATSSDAHLSASAAARRRVFVAFPLVRAGCVVGRRVVRRRRRLGRRLTSPGWWRATS